MISHSHAEKLGSETPKSRVSAQETKDSKLQVLKKVVEVVAAGETPNLKENSLERPTAS